MRSRDAMVLALAIAAAGLTDLPAAEFKLPPRATVRTRMGFKTQVFLYPPTVPPKAGAGAVLFFSGDWGWRPLHHDLATHLAAEGRYVVGIDSIDYFGRKLEPSDWRVDLKTLRTFVNEKAGRAAESPVLLVGFTYGAEVIPYMLNRGGTNGFAGALLIGPGRDSAFIFRVTIQLRMPAPPSESFDVAEEIRRLPPFPVVLMEGGLDTLSQARSFLDLLRGPRKYVPIVGGDRDFEGTRDLFFSMTSQALTWLEGPHPQRQTAGSSPETTGTPPAPAP